MKTHPVQKPRGIALFIVLISIAVLSGMAMIFATQMKVETRLAANSNNETEMEWIGRSGVELARWTLAMELTLPGSGQRYDSLDQMWAGGHGETNDILAGIQLKDVHLGHGIFSVTIVDNERKLNINTLSTDQAMMNRVLTQVGTDASEIPGIIASIQDWIDPDDEVREGGAESAYYQALPHPYNAKNAPLDNMSELLMIKGVTPDVYWGPNSTNHPPGYFQSNNNPPNRNSLMPNAPLLQVGLQDIFTPISNGKLNILTATETELQFLPLVDAQIASQIVKLRQETGDNTFLPYSSPAELLVNTSLGREGSGMAANYCTFRSSVFEVQVDVQVASSPKRTYYALLQRNSPRDIAILNFHWEDAR